MPATRYWRDPNPGAMKAVFSRSLSFTGIAIQIKLVPLLLSQSINTTHQYNPTPVGEHLSVSALSLRKSLTTLVPPDHSVLVSGLSRLVLGGTKQYTDTRVSGISRTRFGGYKPSTKNAAEETAEKTGSHERSRTSYRGTRQAAENPCCRIACDSTRIRNPLQCRRFFII